MATVYPTAAGAWSTRTWNNDATGAAYGMAPQAGDTVLANGLAITIDVDITVESLRSVAGTNAVAGGSFTTSGTRTINADTHQGSASASTLTLSDGSIQNGDSYGNVSTTRAATTVNSGCAQYGNASGGTGLGTTVNAGGWLIGNATGGSDFNCFGASVLGMHIGNATGGTGDGAHGVRLFAGGFFYGNASGSTTHDCSGVQINANSIAIVETATGNATNRFGVLSTLTTLHVVVIKNESGTHPKSLGSGADTTYDLIPFADRPLPSAIATAVWSRVGRTLTS